MGESRVSAVGPEASSVLSPEFTERSSWKNAIANQYKGQQDTRWLFDQNPGTSDAQMEHQIELIGG